MSYNNFNFSVKERSKFYEPILGERGYYSNLIVTDEDGSKEVLQLEFDFTNNDFYVNDDLVFGWENTKNLSDEDMILEIKTYYMKEYMGYDFNKGLSK